MRADRQKGTLSGKRFWKAGSISWRDAQHTGSQQGTEQPLWRVLTTSVSLRPRPWVFDLSTDGLWGWLRTSLYPGEETRSCLEGQGSSRVSGFDEKAAGAFQSKSQNWTIDATGGWQRDAPNNQMRPQGPPGQAPAQMGHSAEEIRPLEMMLCESKIAFSPQQHKVLHAFYPSEGDKREGDDISKAEHLAKKNVFSSQQDGKLI